MKFSKYILSALICSSFAVNAAEVSGKFTVEKASYTEAGTNTGDFGTSTIIGSGATANYKGVSTTATPTHASGDDLKSEISARIYIDGDETSNLLKDSTYHVELNLSGNSDEVNALDGHESYTQRDALREAYIDTTVNDWAVRLGKQQVVWGTADGMKLLDMINPTDYSEMAQNQMEDSRIPVWMVNADKYLEDGGNLQVIVSQPRENIFVGLNRHIDTGVRSNNPMTLDDTTLNNGTDTGSAFLLKGPDTITGVYNGFLNIAPDMGSIATRFDMAFTPTSTTNQTPTLNTSTYNPASATLANLGSSDAMKGFTLDIFEGMSMGAMANALANTTAYTESMASLPGGFYKSVQDTWTALAQSTEAGGLGGTSERNGYIGDNNGDGTYTAADLTGAHMLAFGFAPLYNTNTANMTSEKDAAFDYMGNATFYTFDRFVNARSQYVYNMPKDSDLDLAFRYKNTTPDGMNYSFNFSHNYDKNPVIDLSWRNDAGEILKQNADITYDAGNYTTTSVGRLQDSAGKCYGANNASNANSDGITCANAGGTPKSAILTFEQNVKRVTNIGGSFDMAVETEALGPVVIRGEALYTKGSHSPVIDKTRLGIGDLVGALKMVESDRFKFVLGADITAFTNMMISAQFIQDSELDYVDGADRYTADYSTMSLSNGFNKAIEDKNFYSLFVTKPYGASDQHRFNNIYMIEEGGGRWNRLDTEYTIDDNTVGTIEWNRYWGNDNTQFGQLKNSSNLQIGIKRTF